jgi:hypothetical protein
MYNPQREVFRLSEKRGSIYPCVFLSLSLKSAADEEEKYSLLRCQSVFLFKCLFLYMLHDVVLS